MSARASTQPLIGLLLDATGDYSISILSMAVFAALEARVALTLKTK